MIPVAYDPIVVDGLKNAPSLRILTVAYNTMGVPMIRILATNRTLKEIRLFTLPSPELHLAMDCRPHYQQLDPRLEDIVVFQSGPSSDVTTDGAVAIAPPSNPLFVPMARVNSHVFDMIWGRILRFALEVDAEYLGHPLLFKLGRTKASVPRVSRHFRVSFCDPFRVPTNALCLETLPPLHLRLSSLSASSGCVNICIQHPGESSVRRLSP
jgi:hypothetical protein